MTGQVKYAMITYSFPGGSEPVLAELGVKDGKAMALGHGFVGKLIELGATVTPLVPMPQATVETFRTVIAMAICWCDKRHSHDDNKCEPIVAMRAMLADAVGVEGADGS